MDDKKNREGLIEHFGPAVKDPSVMAECLSILRLYSLPPDELYFKWEAFVLNHLQKAKADFTLENARELRKDIQREAMTHGGNLPGSTAPGKVGVGVKKEGGATPVVKKEGGSVKRMGGLDFLESLNSPSPANKKARPNSTPASSRLSSSLAGPSATPRPIPPRLNYGTPSASQSNGVASSPGSWDSSLSGTPMMGNKFATRTNALQVTDTLGPSIAPAAVPAIPHDSNGKSRVQLSTAAEIKTYDYKYMFEKITERSEVLDERIDNFGELIRRAYGIEEDMTDPSQTGDDIVYVVGQLHSETSPGTKDNDSSILIQSSRMTGSGARVALRFDVEVKVRGGPPGVAGAGLFPGGIFAFRGRNSSGMWFSVEEILLPPPQDAPLSGASQLLEYQYGQKKLDGSPMSVFSAAGPFTLSADLEYAPFECLMAEVKRSRPDVVILLGPFVDSSHPLIAKGELDVFPADLFRSKITEPLLEVMEASPATNIILIPSVRDVISSQMSFPQGMFDREVTGGPKRLRLLPNPCVLNFNEVSFAVSSADIIFHLGKEIYFKRAQETDPDPDVPPQREDKLANISRGVIGQRSFYPLYPTPPDASHEVNLDLTHYDLLKLGSLPDVLILPSQMGKFAKIVDNVVVTNPGRLTNSSAGGTFARMTIQPLDRAKLVSAASTGGGGGEEEMLEHEVHSRIRVEIVRI